MNNCSEIRRILPQYQANPYPVFITPLTTQLPTYVYVRLITDYIKYSRYDKVFRLTHCSNNFIVEFLRARPFV